jgi:hypothetical protein
VLLEFLLFGWLHIILIGSLLWYTWEHSIACSQLLYRYDMASNQWREESHVPKKALHNSSFGFVVLDGELHVMTLLNAVDSTETRRKRRHKRARELYIQIYHPKKKTWRFLTTKSPFPCPLDFNRAVMCSVRLWASIFLICVVQYGYQTVDLFLHQPLEKNTRKIYVQSCWCLFIWSFAIVIFV